MTRILSYNILAGGYSLRENNVKRTQQLLKLIRATDPDIVGVAEAVSNHKPQKPMVIEELAEQLGMQLILGGASDIHEFQPALLTRLPIVYKKIHLGGALTRPVIEVCLEEANGHRLVVFVTHLSAAFYSGWAGNAIRTREIQQILRIMSEQQARGVPHLIMGDFNSLAPGDAFKASFLLRYIVQLDRKRRHVHLSDGHPHLNFVVPPRLRFLNPLLRSIPRSQILSYLFDLAAFLYAPREPIALLRDAGYTDCYRRVHPRSWGFTCPAAAPAGRIDFIFASPTLVKRLESCDVLVEGEEGFSGSDASDHLPVAAEFGVSVTADLPQEDTQGIPVFQ